MNVNKDIERLRGLEYIPEGHVDFFESITKAHDKAKEAISKDEVYPALDKETTQKMLSEGFPLVGFDRMKVKVRPLRAHLKELCSILMKYEESEPGQIEAFSKSETCKKLDLKEFIGKTVSLDAEYLKSLCKKTGVDENTLKFMGITLARPLFESAATVMKNGFDRDSWGKNYCPTCGSEPFMAKIRKPDNARILGCSLCGTQWKFDRVRCPFCDHHDSDGKDLKHFYYHEQSVHRLYVCDKCKRYIKCVDERKMGLGKEIDFSVEDMATLYLDTLAKEKGYASGWNTKGTEGQEVNSQ